MHACMLYTLFRDAEGALQGMAEGRKRIGEGGGGRGVIGEGGVGRQARVTAVEGTLRSSGCVSGRGYVEH